MCSKKLLIKKGSYTLKKGIKSRIITVASLICLGLSSTGLVNAQEVAEPVLRSSPAQDAAIVEELEGFQNFTHESLTGNYSMPEGLVIRQSSIEDGQVIIPAGGLYYTIRISNFNTNPFGENVQYMLGEKFHWVDFKFNKDVLTDATYHEVGDAHEFGDGSKTLELTNISMTGPGFLVPQATFSILKPSGNYYGNTFTVATDDLLLDPTTGVLDNGSGFTTGSYEAGEDGFDWNEEYYYSSVDSYGASYLVAEEITSDSFTIKEFATAALQHIYVTEEEPLKMDLALGETEQVGDWTVEVLDIAENTATVSMTHLESGEVVEKEFGPLTPENTARIPADEVKRHLFTLMPDSEDVLVQLDIYNNPFEEEGTVKLEGFYDVQKLENGQVFEDDRFIFRPDVCSSCNLPVEILIENKDPIVLDAENNVFEGPNGYFTLVLEDFDGEKVNSWYVEDSLGNRTENLSDRAQGAHIDLLLNTSNRTIDHFISRFSGDLMQELRDRIAELEAQFGTDVSEDVETEEVETDQEVDVDEEVDTEEEDADTSVEGIAPPAVEEDCETC